MYVYVISAGPEAQKIGITKSPGDRLVALQTGHYLPLSLEFARFTKSAALVERSAHAAARELRLSGEWFETSPERAINIVKAAIERVDGPVDEEWTETGGWKHAIGDRVICRAISTVAWPGPLPVPGEVYTIADTYDTGQVDLLELPNDHVAFCPSLFHPACASPAT